MSARNVALPAMVAIFIGACHATANAQWGPIYDCWAPPVPFVPHEHVVNACPPEIIRIGAVNIEPSLEPIIIQETYSVEVPVRERVIGPDGKPRIVTRLKTEQRTRTRVLRTANEQIEYLKDKLVELERQRVTPLEGRVDQLESSMP